MSGLVVPAADLLAAVAAADAPVEVMTPAVAAKTLGVTRARVRDFDADGKLRRTYDRHGNRRYTAESVLALRELRMSLRRATGGSSPAAGTAHAAPPQPVGRR